MNLTKSIHPLSLYQSRPVWNTTAVAAPPYAVMELVRVFAGFDEVEPPANTLFVQRPSAYSLDPSTVLFNGPVEVPAADTGPYPPVNRPTTGAAPWRPVIAAVDGSPAVGAILGTKPNEWKLFDASVIDAAIGPNFRGFRTVSPSSNGQAYVVPYCRPFVYSCCKGRFQDLPDSYWMTVALPACFGLGETVSVEMPFRGTLAYSGACGCTPPNSDWFPYHNPTWLGTRTISSGCCVTFNPGGDPIPGVFELTAMLVHCGTHNRRNGNSMTGIVDKIRVSLAVTLRSSEGNFICYRMRNPGSCYANIYNYDPINPFPTVNFYGRLIGHNSETVDPRQLPPCWWRFIRQVPLDWGYVGQLLKVVYDDCPSESNCDELALSGSFDLVGTTTYDLNGLPSCCGEITGYDEYGNPIYSFPSEFNGLAWQLTT